MSNKYISILLRLASIILACVGYYILVNSSQHGYTEFMFYLSESQTNVSSSPSTFNILLEAFIKQYQLIGSILLAVGVFFTLKK